jgi:hypothetical protein
MTVAPSRSAADRLASGVVSGITTVAGTPLRRAYQATAWAMLPALAVQTPSASSSSDRDSMSEPAPRILNDPIGCNLELQVDHGVRHVGVEPDERRSDRAAGDALARALDLLERERRVRDGHRSKVWPRPSATARSNTCRAAAASSTA